MGVVRWAISCKIALEFILRSAISYSLTPSHVLIILYLHIDIIPSILEVSNMANGNNHTGRVIGNYRVVKEIRCHTEFCVMVCSGKTLEPGQT